MNEFIQWETLTTYGGALAGVSLLTQFTKSIPGIQKIPTQIWSYLLAVVVLICAHIFTDGLNAEKVGEIVLNAVVVSMASNGAYQLITNTMHVGSKANKQ